MSTDDKLAAARAAYLAEMGANYDCFLGRCESPVERLLLAAFIQHGWSPAGMLEHLEISHGLRSHAGIDPNRHITALWRDDSGHALLVQPTVMTRGTKPSRFDFALVAIHSTTEGPPRIAIEVDGHDFHERTRDQVSRDKARDRRAALSGWLTLRYSGSDVYRDADGIAEALFWEAAGQPLEEP